MPRLALSEAETQKKRNAVVREATLIVGRLGLNGLSMRALGDAVGLTPGALYRYFPSKQDVLWAMWAVAIGDLRAAFAGVRNDGDPLSSIRSMMAAYVRFALADRDRFRALFLENDQGSIDLLTCDPDALAPYQALRAEVADAMARGLLRPGAPEQATNMLWSGVHGVLTLAVTVREIDFGDIETLAGETLETLLRGLRVEKDGDAR